MRKIIWQFLNTKYSGVVIYHQLFNLDNRRNEKFVTDSYESIMEFTYFYSGKDVRTHINPIIRESTTSIDYPINSLSSGQEQSTTLSFRGCPSLHSLIV